MSLNSFWRPLTGVCLILAVVASANAADADNWPQFRGPSGTGYVATGSIPAQWTSEDYRWQVELPGDGVGSPVIHDGTIYLLVADTVEQQRLLIALEAATGRQLWQRGYPLRKHHLHSRNTFASSTPYVDDSGVYAAWGDPESVSLVAVEHDGTPRWQRDLGSWQSQHGFGTSPVILADKLILFNSQQGEQLEAGQRPGVSKMMAFDPSTGETLWETKLNTTRACYGVPLLRTAADGTHEIVGANTGDGIFALDAQSGRMRWKLPVFSARCVSSPLAVGDLLLGSAGSGGGGNHLVAVRPPQSAADKPAEVYRITRQAPYVPTPAVVGNRLFMVDDRGIASCVDAETGQRLWKERVGGVHSASPLVIGDRVLMINTEGRATLVRAADRYEPLASFELGGPVQATPAWSGDLLILRIADRLCALPAES